MASPYSKDHLRFVALQKRSEISDARRKAAERLMAEKLVDLLKGHKLILSYAAVGSEMSLDPLNHKLAHEGKLVLPKVEGSSLGLYQVFDPDLELIPSKWGVRQPNTLLCPKVEPANIDAALVPALYFDREKMRLGYGKGHFDRFLPKLCKKALILGVGFKEQLYSEILPSESHDHPLSELLLF